MAKQILQDGATFGVQTNKINENFTELYEGKVNEEVGKSLMEDSEITRLATVTNQTKVSLGLGNVDNTADADKPITDNMATALSLKVDKETGKSLIANSEITRLASVKNYSAGANITIDPITNAISATGELSPTPDASSKVVAGNLQAVSGDNIAKKTEEFNRDYLKVVPVVGVQEATNGYYNGSGLFFTSGTFKSIKFPVNPIYSYYASTTLNNNAIHLAIFYNSAGAYLGKQRAGTNTPTEVKDELLVMPAGTAFVGMSADKIYGTLKGKTGAIDLATKGGFNGTLGDFDEKVEAVKVDVNEIKAETETVLKNQIIDARFRKQITKSLWKANAGFSDDTLEISNNIMKANVVVNPSSKPNLAYSFPNNPPSNYYFGSEFRVTDPFSIVSKVNVSIGTKKEIITDFVVGQWYPIFKGYDDINFTPIFAKTVSFQLECIATTDFIGTSLEIRNVLLVDLKPPYLGEKGMPSYEFKDLMDSSGLKFFDGSFPVGKMQNFLLKKYLNPAYNTDVWNRLKAYFNPTTEYTDVYGSFPNPEIFYDGVRVVNTNADMLDRQAEIKTKWNGLLGTMPAVNTAQTMTITATDQKEGYKKHTVTFLHTTTDTKTAYLLVPDKAGKLPAAVTLYYDPETAIGEGLEKRDFALQLVLQGYVVLSVGVTNGNEIFYKPTQTTFDKQPIVMMNYIAANAYEVLAKHAKVDPTRIGIVGHSYGGKWAMFSSCMYDKYALGVWSDPAIIFDNGNPAANYWTADYLGAIIPLANSCKNSVPNTTTNPMTGAYKSIIEQGLNTTELHALMYPRPFLLSGGTDGGILEWTSLNYTKKLYEKLGVKNKIAFTKRGGHAPTDESNKQIIDFFNNFLNK